MAVATPSVTDICLAAQAASRELAGMSTAVKDAALLRVADALEERAPEILEANARDLEAGRESGLSDALMDRLALDPARISAIADAVRAIAALPDPVGEVIDGHRLPNGLDVRKVRVPLGVDRRRLRGAAERDGRRRRAVPEVRQRDRAARLLLGGALERRARLDRRPGVPRGRGLARRPAAASSSPSSPARRASST